MNFLKKILKYFQRKFIRICFLVILICVLVASAVFGFSPTPNKVDIEIQRKRTSGPGKATINKTFELYQEQKVDWKFMHGFYGYYWHHYCHRKCGIDGPFGYFWSNHKYNLQMTKALLQNELCKAPFKAKDSCRWRAYSMKFHKYFAYFSIPLTIILNFINLATILQTLGNGAGPALYLHTAEIVTDGILNIIVGLHSCLLLFFYLDYWLRSCGYYRYFSSYQSVGVMQRFVSFLNQAYLMGLLADRHSALTNPYDYNAMTDQQKKKRAKTIIFKIFLGSFTFYLPFILFYTFFPIFLYWMTISKFWKGNLHQIDFFFTTFYVIIAFDLLISQLIYGVRVERKFHKFIKNKMDMNQESEVELKKRERDKQLLFGGTIGLNIITGLIMTLFNMINNNALYAVLGYSDQRPWWSQIFYMADPVLTFVNGNGALVIHIIFVHSYRKAFKATCFGRLIFRQPVNPAEQYQ